MNRNDRKALSCFALLASIGALAFPLAATAQGTGLPLDTIYGSYARIIELHSTNHNGAHLATSSWSNGPDATPDVPFYRAEAGSTSWSKVSTLTAGTSGGYVCCTTLFEFPQQLGTHPAGTVLLGTRNGNSDATATIDIWRSDDGGDSWNFQTTVANTVGSTGGSLWEPEFAVDSNGDLVVYISDERNQPNGSQAIIHYVSTDGGDTWSGPTTDISVTDGSRPGMPRVVHVPGGSYVMAYEYCGTDNCRIHTRTSGDGLSWGDPADRGPLVESPRGGHFQGTPTLTYVPGSTPTLALLGHFLIDTPDGQGTTIMKTNDLSGASGWYETAAPFSIVNNYSSNPNTCDGYSSTLLSSDDGSFIYLVAGVTVSADDHCKMYVGPF